MLDPLRTGSLCFRGVRMLLAEDRKALLTTVGYETWEEQDDILNHKARIKLVAGGERAGKSFLGALSISNRLDEFESGDI